MKPEAPAGAQFFAFKVSCREQPTGGCLAATGTQGAQQVHRPAAGPCRQRPTGPEHGRNRYDSWKRFIFHDLAEVKYMEREAVSQRKSSDAADPP
jgi:hypothetical protein